MGGGVALLMEGGWEGYVARKGKKGMGNAQ